MTYRCKKCKKTFDRKARGAIPRRCPACTKKYNVRKNRLAARKRKGEGADG